jgi:hypothetical protein
MTDIDPADLNIEKVTINKALTDRMFHATFTLDKGAEFSTLYFNRIVFQIPNYAGPQKTMFLGIFPSSQDFYAPAANKVNLVGYDYAWFLTMQYLDDEELVIPQTVNPADWVYGLLNGTAGWEKETGIEPYRIVDVPGWDDGIVHGADESNIDQHLDPDHVYANTYALTAALDEGATHRQTFTPTGAAEAAIIRVGVWVVESGAPGEDWYMELHDAAETLLASALIPHVQVIEGAWNYFTTSYYWAAGALHFHIYASAIVGNPTLKCNIADDLETCSFIENFSKGYAVEFDFETIQSKMSSVDDVCEYTKYIFVVKWRDTVGAGDPDDFRPCAYFIHEDNIDLAAPNGLDIPAHVHVTHGTETTLAMPITVDRKGEEKYNRVTVGGQGISGIWYWCTVESAAVTAGAPLPEAIPIEYYVESKDLFTQADVDAAAAALYAYFNEQVTTYHAVFVGRSDLELLQQLVFAGYYTAPTGWMIPDGTYRIVGITYDYEKYRSLCHCTLVPDSKFSSQLRLRRIMASSALTIQALIRDALQKEPGMEVGEIRALGGDVATVETERGIYKTSRDASG